MNSKKAKKKKRCILTLRPNSCYNALVIVHLCKRVIIYKLAELAPAWGRTPGLPGSWLFALVGSHANIEQQGFEILHDIHIKKMCFVEKKKERKIHICGISIFYFHLSVKFTISQLSPSYV